MPYFVAPILKKYHPFATFIVSFVENCKRLQTKMKNIVFFSIINQKHLNLTTILEKALYIKGKFTAITKTNCLIGVLDSFGTECNVSGCNSHCHVLRVCFVVG